MELKLSDLLSKGYFPKELPPPFTSTSYSEVLTGQSSAPYINIFSSPPTFSPPCVHNLVRTGGLRRNLSIPNPKHFFHLAKHIVEYWTNFKACTDKSPFSLTKPVCKDNDRAISPEHELSERVSYRAKLRSAQRFLLKADISRFFPSIYSHVIPWAALGKANAKTAHNQKTLKNTWTDKTDIFSRSISNNQTIGIPIGPDTSRLISEVILSEIDTQLASKFEQLEGIRYIDDYEFVLSTRSEAEKVLSHLQHLLNEFELALNSSKTKIIKLPDCLDSIWTSKIRVFMFRDAGITGQKNDIIAYFDMVFDLFKEYPEEGLLKYAIARLQSEEIKLENWSLFENLLSHCVLIEPACIPQVCDQLVYYSDSSKDFPIAKPVWAKCLNLIISERVPLGQSSEAAWAMWLMKILQIELLEKNATIVGNAEDSVVGLMALALSSIGLANSNHLSGLNRFNDGTELFGNQWLLCYQGNLMNWLGPQSGHGKFQGDPAFSYLASQDVSFFDINVPVPQPKRHILSGSGGGGGGEY